MTPGPPRQHVAVYPGSFDPVTFGHLDVIRRGRRLFDLLVVAVGRNPGKDQLFTPDERVEMIRLLVREIETSEPDGATVQVESYSGLTVDFGRAVAARAGVGAVALLRGIRNLSDLQNEIQQALTNRQVAGLETAFVVAGQDFAYTSSSLIKQVTAMGGIGGGDGEGGDGARAALSTMVPPLVIDRLMAKRAERHPALERLRAQEEE